MPYNPNGILRCTKFCRWKIQHCYQHDELFIIRYRHQLIIDLNFPRVHKSYYLTQFFYTASIIMFESNITFD